MTGNYDNGDALWHREHGKYESLIYRESLETAKQALQNGCRVLYLHANLGNGKTIFLECLKQILLRKEYKIFDFKRDYPKLLPDDVKHIAKTFGKKIVIIENYFNQINILEKFAIYAPKDIQFILTARTVMLDTRIREANEVLDIREGESKIIGINKLSNKELYDFSCILNKNGMWGEHSNLSESKKKTITKCKAWKCRTSEYSCRCYKLIRYEK